MSVHVTSWVLRHSETRLGQRLVLLVLADKADADGTNAWPSVATIAQEARMTERQVQRCLRELVAAGAIRQTGRHRVKGQRHGTYVYDVVMSKGDKMSPFAETKGDNGDAQRVSQMSPEPSLEPSDSSTTANAVVSHAPAETYDPRKGMKILGRNLPFDALAESTNADVKAEAGRLGKALKKIRDLEADEMATWDDAGDAEEALAVNIRRRASLYRQRWPNVELTPTALAENWARVLTPSPGMNLAHTHDVAEQAVREARERRAR